MAFYDQLFLCGPTRLGSALNRRTAQSHWRKIRKLAPQRPRVVEVGPGKPLSGFFKSIEIAVTHVGDLADAERLSAT